jgi:hypothetical protein
MQIRKYLKFKTYLSFNNNVIDANLLLIYGQIKIAGTDEAATRGVQ